MVVTNFGAFFDKVIFLIVGDFLLVTCFFIDARITTKFVADTYGFVLVCFDIDKVIFVEKWFYIDNFRCLCI